MSNLRPKKQIEAPATGATVTVQNAMTDIRLIVKPIATLLALTVAFPNSPYDGQILNIAFTQIITGLTLTSASTILGALTTVSAVNGFVSYVYESSTTTWYRMG